MNDDRILEKFFKISLGVNKCDDAWNNRRIHRMLFLGSLFGIIYFVEISKTLYPFMVGIFLVEAFFFFGAIFLRFSQLNYYLRIILAFFILIFLCSMLLIFGFFFYVLIY